ncbi:phosphoribosyl-ATP diphosphatase [Candidatus Daviesbacteria bacterium]|nr:phosphoribosyl-ATP diphosphatase [Candidatus Daviesbacteria bacterium]
MFSSRAFKLVYNIIEDRKDKRPKGSYIISLFNEGGDRIAQKVGEEAIEVIVAAKNESKQRIISEVADLFFHTLILLSSKNIKLSDILKELKQRQHRH